ncbi:MAG: DUF177 domain-containing protein [Ignavibacteriales bacterium]|nr:DUF177 domain-containing protein [Ignavibacteriales bacterium]
MSVLKINISNLPEGIHQRSLEATPEEVGLDNRFAKAVIVNATLEKTSRQLYLKAECKAVGNFTCDRCLEEFEKEVVASYRVMYVAGDRSAEGLKEDEVQVIPPEANAIDLGEDVRQFIMLVLPQKILCKEECAGLCPTCGTNRNTSSCDCRKEETDPRWEGLKKFLEN